MYKKIIHNITEEHFEHPLAMELMGMGNCMVSSNTHMMSEPTVKSKLQADSAVNFRIQIINNLSTINRRLRAYVVSVTSGDGLDILGTQAQIKNDVITLANSLSQYYNQPDGSVNPITISEPLQKVISDVYDFVSMTKNKSDLTAIKKTMADDIDALSMYLNKLNPRYWAIGTLTDFWTQYFTAVLSQITSRFDKNWAVDLASDTDANDILIVNGVRPMTTYNQSLAMYLVNGTMQAYPGRFVY